MEYRLCDDTWDEGEEKAIDEVLKSHMFTMGKKVKEYEEQFAKKVGTKYAVMVNSGSSANLLAIMSLVYAGKLKKGDEVLVTAVSWSTTYFPLTQAGLKIRFVDIDADTLNIDVDKLKEAVTDQTKMIFLVNLLGNPNDFDEIQKICDKHNIFYAEDNCESLGAEYKGKKAGSFGFFGTFSTFFSHHLCTMEGGVVTTNDEELFHYMLCVRAHGWTRNLPSDSKIYSKVGDNFYESYNFIVPGYNLRPLEMEAAVGIEQMKKWDRIIAQRRKNAAYFRQKLDEIPGIRTQKEIGTSSYFGFPIILEKENKGRRNEVIKYLVQKEIEVRPIVAGNFTRNQAVKYMDYSIYGTLDNANEIHENGFFVGNHSCNNQQEVNYLIQCLKEICK